MKIFAVDTFRAFCRSVIVLLAEGNNICLVVKERTARTKQQ